MRKKTTQRPVRSKLAEAIGGRIRMLRLQKQWSQAAFCIMIGLHTTKLSKYENGEHLPPHLTLVLIADALGVSVDFLMGRLDREPSILEIPSLLETQYRDAAASILTGALLLLEHARREVKKP